MALHELRAQRATAFDQFKEIAEKPNFKTDTDQPEFDRLQTVIKDIDAAIVRAKAAQDLEARTAKPVEGQPAHQTFAQVKDDPWTHDQDAERIGVRTSKGLVLGGMIKMLCASASTMRPAEDLAAKVYGESHPVTKALLAGVGAAGGFVVPPDYIAEIIELLRAETVVRGAGPRVLPMPRGTMTLPAQTAAATASYGSEVQVIPSTQQTFGDIVATFKKLTALVPVSNSLMRYADPAMDAIVRDDLVLVMGLREDLAFLTGDGTNNTPRGFLSFANAWAVANGGAAGTWLTTANSTAATNGIVQPNGSSGNFVTSNETYTLATVVSEISLMATNLDLALVPNRKRVWFMHHRTFNYLFDVQNSLGEYVFRPELMLGTLRQLKVYKSQQIPVNIWDTTGTNKDCTFVFMVEMPEAMILDSMQLELMVSREGTYNDVNGVMQSAVQNDQTLIRAITEHDFQMRHVQAISVNQFVRWGR